MNAIVLLEICTLAAPMPAPLATWGAASWLPDIVLSMTVSALL